MSEYFKSRRRKAGCVLLLMSALCTALWIRTLVYGDIAWYTIKLATIGVGSLRGGVFYFYRPGQTAGPERDWKTIPDNEISQAYADADLAEVLLLEFNEDEDYVRYLMYWQLALPSAIVAAALLLWPIRRKPS